ncbi:MAG: type II secretion system protein, partial [Candidatus Paceibacterota bacterium]
MNKSTKKQFAFTLIELLVVIAIIGILSALIVVGMNSTTQKATIAKAQVFANSLRNSLMSDLISEWKLDAKSVSGPPYTTTDTWGTNTGTLMDVDNACSFSGTLKCPQLATNCPSGNCFSFDGIDDYVDLGAGANTDLRNTSFTFSAFIKTSTANSGR